MKLNIEFLQTGGVPLTNDLMSCIMEAIKLYDAVGSLAGHMTIIAGCDPVAGSTTTVNPGVVAVNDEVLFFEGGLISANVFVHEENISKTFQDQTSKVLIKKRTVKFGNATPPNSFVWAEFKKLQTLKDMQIAIAGKAEKTVTDDHEKRIKKLELQTAPIFNGGVIWAFGRPVSEIPVGWKECLDTRGKTIVHCDPNDPLFSTLRANIGKKEVKLTSGQLPKIKGNFETVISNGFGLNGIFAAVSQYAAYILGSNNGQYSHKNVKLEFGNDEAHENIQPSHIANFIEPDFPN